MIQLHGDESPDYCRQFPAATVVKAIELKNDDDVDRALDYEVAALLADARHAGLYGGTGKKSDWSLARKIKNKKPLILSGGLNAENIAEVKCASPSRGRLVADFNPVAIAQAYANSGGRYTS
jgi:phosphoribosylanthranilate isomerase